MDFVFILLHLIIQVLMGQRKLLSQLTHFSEDDGPAAVWLLKYLMTRGCMSDRPKDRNTWCLLPRHDLHFLLRNLEVFPDLIGYIILFSQLHRKVSRRHADQMQSLSKSDTVNLEKETCFSRVHVKYVFYFFIFRNSLPNSFSCGQVHLR